MTNDSGKKPREFWIGPSIDQNEIGKFRKAYFHEVKNLSGLVHVREVIPGEVKKLTCTQCGETFSSAPVSTWKMIGEVQEENKQLKKQLEMCKEALKEIRICPHHSTCDGLTETTGLTIDFTRCDCHVSVARECLNKLEKE